MRESFENNIRIDPNSIVHFELVEDAGKKLSEAFQPIQNLLFILRKKLPKILQLIAIIEESQAITKEQNIESLVDLFCHQFYENLLIPNPENEELLILCTNLLIKEIENMNSASISSFINDTSSFVGKLLKSYTKRQDLKAFLTQTLGDTILKIENSSEKLLDLDVTRLGAYIKDKKAFEMQQKSYNSEKSKTILVGIDNENLTQKIRKSRLTKTGRSTLESQKTFSNTLKTPYLSSKLSDAMISTNSSSNNINTPLNRAKTEDYVLEFVDNIQNIKYDQDSNDDFNNDYTIEISQDEIFNRLYNETDGDVKIFYQRQLERICKDPDIYTNKKL